MKTSIIVKNLKYYMTKYCHLIPSDVDNLVLNFTNAYV